MATGPGGQAGLSDRCPRGPSFPMWKRASVCVTVQYAPCWSVGGLPLVARAEMVNLCVLGPLEVREA